MAVVIPDVDILTNLLIQFKDVISSHSDIVKGYAIKVLLTVGMIDFLIVVLLSLMDENNHPLAQTLLKRTLKYGAFGYLVYSYGTIVSAINNSFVKLGLAAGGDVMTVVDFTNPSKISAMGFHMCMPFISNLINGKGTSDNGAIIDVLTSIPSTLFYLLILVAVMFCFFIIAINIFIIYVEFAIFTTLALILVPFGIWDKTEFIFDKVKNGVINFGIKYMTMAFVVSISITMVKNWTFPGVASIQQYLYVLVGMLAITYLCMHVPSLVAGMMGGSGGSMTAAGMAGFAAGAARNTGVTKVSKMAGKAALGAASGGLSTAKAAITAKVGSMTGFADKSVAGTGGTADTGGTGGEQSTSKSDASNFPTTPTTSGVNLNSNVSQTQDTGTIETAPDTSTQSAAKTAGPANPPISSGVDIAPQATGTTGSTSAPTMPPAQQTAPSPKGPPPIKPSGVNVPPSAPNTNPTTV